MKYIIPFSYLFASRVNTNFERISWFLIFPFPVAALAYYYSGLGLLDFSLSFTLVLTIFYFIYETGYLENDIKTVKHEKDPHYWIEKETLNSIENNYWFIINGRFALSLLLLMLLYGLFDDFYIVQFIGCLVITRVFFLLHNKIRNRLNILTYLLISSSKQFCLLAFFYNYISDKHTIFFVFVMFPLVRSIEHATKERYGLVKLREIISALDVFRVGYYFTALVISAIMFREFREYYVFLGIIVYLLMYRLSTLMILRSSSLLHSRFRNNKRY